MKRVAHAFVLCCACASSRVATRAPSPTAEAKPIATENAASPPPAAAEGDVLEGYVVAREICKTGDAGCEDSLVVSYEKAPRDTRMFADGNTKVLVPSARAFALGARVNLKVRAAGRQPFEGDPCCARLAPYVVRLVR
jgi:hypothetical protein